MTTTTVCVSVDFDATAVWMSYGAFDEWRMSRGEFGVRVGAKRLLDLFAQLDILSTWYIPGHTAETNPAVSAEVARLGHEIGNHGYAHEGTAMPLDQATHIIEKTNDALERVTGQRPRGARLTWDFLGDVFEVMVEQGMTYSSNLMNDYRAHWAHGLGEINVDRASVKGPILDLVEVPFTFITSDFAYFEFAGYGVGPHLPAGLRNPRDVEVIWKDEFDYLREHGHSDGFMMMTLHPESIGWGSRIMMLERFLHYCRDNDARFVTAETIAGEFRAREGKSAAVA